MKGQFPEIIKLGDLNGHNGFKLDGEASGDQSSDAVSAAGDVNGDGYADLLIGAYRHVSNTGCSYVVFGSAEVGGQGLLALSSLNGMNGFKLDGEATGDYSGHSVSAVGDINGDGYTDLLIGAPQCYGGNICSGSGRSYVVFGGSEVYHQGVLSLSVLNGTNGFKLDGETANDYSGYSVSAAGDINGDGYADLLIGATDYASYTGRSYVVFGSAGVGSQGLLTLSSLNGSNGFKLDGEAMGDYSGWSVSAAGDINGDGHDDLLIGAPYHASHTGRGYVIFGGAGVGGQGLLALSSLNGTNGFKLDGEATGDYCTRGHSVSIAGDVNGDGYVDLLIGAYFHASHMGRSYVVFGGTGVGLQGGLLALSALNGTNGFKLDGEATNDDSGRSVSGVGDVNGDGYDDLLIGAYNRVNGTGRSYVVFGGAGIGSQGLLSLSSFNGTNGFKLDGETANDYSGWSVSAAGDINGDGVVDILIGANQHNSATGRSYVIFGDAPPVLVNNSLSLYPGEIKRLTVDDLAAYDCNHDNNTLLFFPTDLSHGQFEADNAPASQFK